MHAMYRSVQIADRTRATTVTRVRELGWRQRLRFAVIIVGFVIGVMVASFVAAANSSSCEHTDRSITLLPPGLRCFAVKDGVRYIPWSPADSSPIDLIPVIVLGGGLGALLFGVAFARLTRHRPPADPHDA